MARVERKKKVDSEFPGASLTVVRSAVPDSELKEFTERRVEGFILDMAPEADKMTKAVFDTGAYKMSRGVLIMMRDMFNKAIEETEGEDCV